MDPERFWAITPKLLEVEMRGLQQRLRRERELVWFGAMLPHLKKPITLDQFVGRSGSHTDRVREFHAAWDKIDAALNRARGANVRTGA